MEVTRKMFKAIEVDTQRIEEGQKINVVVEGGEVFEATVVEIKAKQLAFHVEGEIGDRAFAWEKVESFDVIADFAE